MTQASGALAETLSGVLLGRTYRLGVAAGFPSGARNISAATFTVGATPLVAGTDYILEADTCLLKLLPTAVNVADDDDVDVAGTLAETIWTRVIANGTKRVGEVILRSVDTKGTPHDWYFPRATIAASGDIALKSNPESPAYQELPLTLSVQADTARGLDAAYCDGRVVV